MSQRARGSGGSILIVAGGAQPSLDRSDVPTVDVVMAADSGFDHARALGLTVDVLVGDLDSISPDGLREAEAAKVKIVRYPAAKNETDLEIAVAAAVKRDPKRIIVIGATGGRLDHQLANIGILAGATAPGRSVEIRSADERVLFAVADAAVDVPGPAGRTVSLVPIGGPATGVTTAGLEWPLTDATLTPYGALGISNVITDGGTAGVTVTGGTLAVIVNLGAV